MKKRMLLILVFTGFGMFAQEEEQETFVQWDLDRDGYIMDDEYNEFWDSNNYMDEFDPDGDGIILLEDWEKATDRYYKIAKVGLIMNITILKSGIMMEMAA